MRVSVDRIGEGVAVLIGQDDSSALIRVPVSLLPPGSREGDILTLTLERDPSGTAAAKERVSVLIDKLKKK